MNIFISVELLKKLFSNFANCLITIADCDKECLVYIPRTLIALSLPLINFGAECDVCSCARYYPTDRHTY